MDVIKISKKELDYLKEEELVKEDEISSRHYDNSDDDETNYTSCSLASKILNIESCYRPKIKSTTIINTKSKIKTDNIVRVQKQIKLNLAEGSEFTFDEKLIVYRKKTENEKKLSEKNPFSENINIPEKRFGTCIEHMTSKLQEMKKPEVRVTFSSIRTEFIFSESEEEEHDEDKVNYESDYEESEEKILIV